MQVGRVDEAKPGVNDVQSQQQHRLDLVDAAPRDVEGPEHHERDERQDRQVDDQHGPGHRQRRDGRRESRHEQRIEHVAADQVADRERAAAFDQRHERHGNLWQAAAHADDDRGHGNVAEADQGGEIDRRGDRQSGGRPQHDEAEAKQQPGPPPGHIVLILADVRTAGPPTQQNEQVGPVEHHQPHPLGSGDGAVEGHQGKGEDAAEQKKGIAREVAPAHGLESDEPCGAEHQPELADRTAHRAADHDAGDVLAGQAAQGRVDAHEQLGQVRADRQHQHAEDRVRCVEAVRQGHRTAHQHFRAQPEPGHAGQEQKEFEHDRGGMGSNWSGGWLRAPSRCQTRQVSATRRRRAPHRP